MANTQDVVTIFQDGNFNGKQQSLAVGRYTVSDLTIGDKALSALKVPAGLRATLFSAAGYQGEVKIVMADMAGVGEWNDKTSSIIVDQPADPDLLLYLPMDNATLEGQNLRLTLPTSLAESDTATAHSGVSLMPDDRFGSCLQFDGSNQAFIELPAMTSDFSTGLTVAAWISYSAFNSWSRIIDFGNGPSNDNLLFANFETQGQLTAHVYKGASDSSLNSSSSALELNKWHYLALTLDSGGKAMLYLDGRPMLNTPVQMNQLNNVRRTSNLIGKSNWGQDSYFKGKMAHLRLYRRPLAASELQGNMAADQMDLPAFRLSHPIAFSLMDSDQHYALYIAEKISQHSLTLTLDNTTAQTINLSRQNQTASADHFHFELRFHADTLSEATLKQWATRPDITDWDVFVRPDNQTVSFFLLHKSQNSLAPAGQLRLTLLNMTAAAGIGARGTQVELRPNPAQLSYANNPTTRISGSRSQFLQIVNETGKQNIPLHAAFIGSQRLLNDGQSPNRLWLRLKNLLVADPTHGQSGEIALNPAGTRFILSLDVSDQDNQPWGVANKSQIAGMHLYLKGTNQSLDEACAAKQTANSDWQISGPSPEAQAANLQWVITSTAAKKTLAAGESLDLALTDLVSSLPSGVANLYLHHENIPNYWDGQLVCPIEKAPLLFGDLYRNGLFQQRSNVGIGVASPKIHLAIGDDDTGLQQQGDGNLAIYTNNVERVRVDSSGRVGIGVTSPKIHLAIGDDDTGLHQQGDGNLAIYTNNVERIRVDSSGRVGIGTNTPAASLHIFQTNANANSAIFDGGCGVQITGIKGTRTGLTIDTESEWGGLGINNSGTGRSIDLNVTNAKNDTPAININYQGTGPTIFTNGQIQCNTLKIGGTITPAASLYIVQANADANSAIFDGGCGVHITGIKGTRTGLIIDTESEWGGLGINNSGTGRSIDLNVTNTKNDNPAININYQGKGATIATNGQIQCATLKIGNTAIGEKELQILQRLANSELTVAIACNANNYLIDNYDGKHNGGDGARTIQFRDNGTIDANTRMRLIIG